MTSLYVRNTKVKKIKQLYTQYEVDVKTRKCDRSETRNAFSETLVMITPQHLHAAFIVISSVPMNLYMTDCKLTKFCSWRGVNLSCFLAGH